MRWVPSFVRRFFRGAVTGTVLVGLASCGSSARSKPSASERKNSIILCGAPILLARDFPVIDGRDLRGEPDGARTWILIPDGGSMPLNLNDVVAPSDAYSLDLVEKGHGPDDLEFGYLRFAGSSCAVTVGRVSGELARLTVPGKQYPWVIQLDGFPA
jgi:hypothetical protein